MTCSRCSGYMVVDWDVDSRSEFMRCVMCGNRPHQITYRADGLPVGSPLLCTACHLRPRSVFFTRLRGEIEIELCEPCRAVYNRKWYRWKKNQRKRKRKQERAA